MNPKDPFQYAQIKWKKKIGGQKNTMILLKCLKDQRLPLKLDQDRAIGMSAIHTLKICTIAHWYWTMINLRKLYRCQTI